MKIVFFGSSEFAIPALEELMALRRHRLELVISQPAKKQGRRLQESEPPLALAALAMGLKLYSPADINSQEAFDKIQALEPDILITASYGAYIGRRLRNLAPLGAINLHPSLLPKYRGANPIRAAILAGESVSGNSIFRLGAKLDAGAILAQESLDIKENELYSHLHDRLANSMALLLPKTLDNIHQISPQKQDESLATYSQMHFKEDLKLDLTQPAETLLRQIRAYSREPGAYLNYAKGTLKILEAELIDLPSELDIGQIHQIIKQQGFSLKTGKGGLLIKNVQAAGKRSMNAYDFSLGARFSLNERIFS